MALTKEQLDAINEGDAQRAYDSKLCQLRAERDKALKRADFAESVARRAAADAHDAIKARDEAEAEVVRLRGDMAATLDENALWARTNDKLSAEVARLGDELFEARRHLRQLLHALDNEKGMGDKPPSHSINVKLAMAETRRYLQAGVEPAGREEE